MKDRPRAGGSEGLFLRGPEIGRRARESVVRRAGQDRIMKTVLADYEKLLQ